MKKNHLLSILLIVLSVTIKSQCAFSVSNSSSLGCAPFQVMFTVPAVNTGTFVWSMESTTVSGISVSHIFNSPGLFVVTVNGTVVSSPTQSCTGTATTAINVVTGPENGCTNTVTGLKENFNQLQWSVFPNPSKGFIQIRAEQELHELSVALYNALGEKIYETAYQQGTIRISTVGLNKGLYSLCIVKDEKCMTRKKVVIE